LTTKLSIFALLGVITLGVTVEVFADASPPLYPPGSAVLPPGETMVQMVAETVEITIVTPGDSGAEEASPARAHFEANFTMRNQGAATERMDVRFPLTDADSWETIWDFAAFVAGERVRVRKSVEPFALGDPRIARWAVFPVAFEPGVEVLITVTYSTGVSGWGWSGPYDVGDTVEDAFFGAMNPDTATVYYTLETGAGWYGPIGQGTIALRLPYEASPANVFDLEADLAEGRYANGWGGGSGKQLSGPSFAGSEARWEFSQLEPTTEDNLSLQFLWPDEWQRILTLQAAAERRPDDPAIALELAGAYLAAGADVYGGIANGYHCLASRQAIDRALVYHPSSEALQEGLEIIASYCPAELMEPVSTTSTSTPIAASPSASPTRSPSSTATEPTTVDMSPTSGPVEPTPSPVPVRETGSSLAGATSVVGVVLAVAIAWILVVVWRRRVLS